jgi:hypothetical protein
MNVFFFLYSKQSDLARKKADVRKRIEEQSRANQKKKGFMTPERKKKLRVRKKRPKTECGFYITCIPDYENLHSGLLLTFAYIL